MDALELCNSLRMEFECKITWILNADFMLTDIT
jgi:hypothetical protein